MFRVFHTSLTAILLLISIAIVGSVANKANAQAFTTWHGTGTGDWSNNANWNGDNASIYGQLQWTGSGSATSNNDISSLSQWRLFFNSSVNYNLTGNAVGLFDYGGQSSWVLNQGSSTPTIGLAVNFSDNGARRGWVTTQSTGGLNMTNVGMLNSVTGVSFNSNNTSGVITVSGVISDSSAAGTRTIWIGRNESFATVANTRVVFSGNNTFNSAVNVDAGQLLVSNAAGLGSTSGSTNVFSGGSLALQGGISIGAEALALNSDGISSGGALRNITGNNTFGGAITLGSAARVNSDAGILTLSGGVGGTQNLSVGGSGDVSVSSVIGIGTGTLTKDGAGSLIFTAANTYSGDTFVNQGRLEFGAGGSVNNSTIRIANAGSGNGEVRLAASGLTLTSIMGASNGGTGTATISATNSSGTNTLTNQIFLDKALIISQSTGGTLNLTSARATDTSTNTGIDIKGFNLALTSNGTIDISGSIYNSSGTGGLVLNGAGTVILRGDTRTTYAGSTSVNSGVASVRSNTGLGSTAGGTSVSSGAALELQGGVAIGAESLTINGSGISTGGALRSVSGNNSFAGAITLGSASQINSDSGTLTLTGGITGAQNLTFGGAGNTTVSGGAIATGSGTLVKSGSGTLTLSSANSYTGNTTVSAGRLIVTSSGAINSPAATVAVNGGELQVNGVVTASALNVGSGATLSGTASGPGTGVINAPVSIASGATLAPGNSIGTLRINGSLTLGGTYAWEVNSTTNAGDILVVNGPTLNLSGSSFTLTDSGVFSIGKKFTLMAYNGSLSGSFSNSFSNWAINYADSSAGLNGNGGLAGTGVSYITISAIPEPNALLLVGLIAAAGTVRRRRGQ